MFILVLIQTPRLYSQYALEDIPDSLNSLSDVIMRKNLKVLTIEDDDKMIMSIDRVMTFKNKESLNYSDLVIPFTLSEKINELKLIVYDKNGNSIRSFKKKNFKETAYDQNNLIDDARLLVLDYTPPSYPISFELQYEYETKNTCFIPSWRPFWKPNISVELDRYTIVNKSQGKISQLEDLKGIPATRSSDSLTYQLSNLNFSQFKTESKMDDTGLPTVHFNLSKFNYEGHKGEIRNWKEYGQWYYKSFILPILENVSEKNKEEFKGLVNDQMSKDEKINSIYKFVQDNTRYISIQLGEGGFKSAPVNDTHKRKYGDCKALSMYTMAILNANDIKSNLVVVNAGENQKSIHETFASHNQANHVFLSIPSESDTTWLECTSNYSPVNFLGSFTDDRKVLLIKESGAELINTPSYTSKSNFSKSNYSVTINSDFTSSITSKVQYSGIDAEKLLRIIHLSESDQLSWAKEKFKQDYTDVTISSLELNLIEDGMQSLVELNSEFETSKFGESLGKHFSIPIFFESLKLPSNLIKILGPVKIRRDHEVKDSFVYVFPKTKQLKGLPKPLNISNDLFDFTFDYELKENKLHVSRQMVLKKGFYPNSYIQSLSEQTQKILKLEKTILLLKAKT